MGWTKWQTWESRSKAHIHPERRNDGYDIDRHNSRDSYAVNNLGTFQVERDPPRGGNLYSKWQEWNYAQREREYRQRSRTGYYDPYSRREWWEDRYTDTRLTDTQIALIVIGVLVGLLILFVIVTSLYRWIRSKHEAKKLAAKGNTNSTTEEQDDEEEEDERGSGGDGGDLEDPFRKSSCKDISITTATVLRNNGNVPGNNSNNNHSNGSATLPVPSPYGSKKRRSHNSPAAIGAKTRPYSTCSSTGSGGGGGLNCSSGKSGSAKISATAADCGGESGREDEEESGALLPKKVPCPTVPLSHSNHNNVNKNSHHYHHRNIVTPPTVITHISQGTYTVPDRADAQIQTKFPVSSVSTISESDAPTTSWADEIVSSPEPDPKVADKSAQISFEGEIMPSPPPQYEPAANGELENRRGHVVMTMSENVNVEALDTVNEDDPNAQHPLPSYKECVEIHPIPKSIIREELLSKNTKMLTARF